MHPPSSPKPPFPAKWILNQVQDDDVRSSAPVYLIFAFGPHTAAVAAEKRVGTRTMSGAQLAVTEMRRATRHPVNHKVIAEHRSLGDLPFHIVNLSAHGFMLDGRPPLDRGERVTIRLPVVGRIEAHLIWLTDDRAGFQFERIIRLDDFVKMIDQVQPNPRLRAAR
jgi:hypothetical protein